MVPKSLKDISSNQHLTRNQIQATNQGLIITFIWSKTNQLKERVVQVPICKIPGSQLCPYNAFLHMCKLCPSSMDSPAFTYKNSHSECIILTHATYVNYLRVLLDRAGYPSALYSGHSFRRGGCSLSFSTGVRSELIKQHGDWKS